MAIANLEIHVKSTNDDINYKVVEFIGDFDKAGHSDIKETLNEVIKNFEKSILIFDFSKLKFINSESIGYLMEIHSYLLDKGKKLVIVGLRPNIEDVFDAIGLSEIIDVYKNLSDFLD